MGYYKIATITETPSLGAEGGGRSLARASSGRLWAVYSKKPGGYSYMQIHCAYSDNDGKTWPEEQVTDIDTAHHFFPSIAIDSSDDLHVVYTGKNRSPYNSRWGVFYNKRTSGSWGSEETVALEDVSLPGQEYPAIAVDSSDDVHVVWNGKGWGSNPTILNIKYRKRTSGSLGSVESITDVATNTQISASIAIEGSNDEGITWFSCHDITNTVITLSAAGGALVIENPKLIRPVLSNGDGSTDVDVYIIAVP